MRMSTSEIASLGLGLTNNPLWSSLVLQGGVRGLDAFGDMDDDEVIGWITLAFGLYCTLDAQPRGFGQRKKILRELGLQAQEVGSTGRLILMERGWSPEQILAAMQQHAMETA